MRIYTPMSDLAHTVFNFPDGQPHIKIEALEPYARDLVVIETAIKSPADLFMVLLAVDVLDKQGFRSVNLDVRYLMGARMDRPIGLDQPLTLQTVSQLVNFCGFYRVRFLDVHSEVALRIINDSENVLPVDIFNALWEKLGTETVVVTPDKGAIPRVKALLRDWEYRYCNMFKVREISTGKLLGFSFDTEDSQMNVKDRDCLIIDDICDGGGTFVGQAKLLKEAGAKKVSLFVTHGIFSKDVPLEGIDHIYTTDSYCTRDLVGTNPTWDARGIMTVFPISMKDL